MTKNKTFRCSCCDQWSEDEPIYKRWSKDDSAKVGICLNCWGLLQAFRKITKLYVLDIVEMNRRLDKKGEK